MWTGERERSVGESLISMGVEDISTSVRGERALLAPAPVLVSTLRLILPEDVSE
jgi:hypothetical protein